MYLGIDLGTSGVKAVLLGEEGDVIATGSAALAVSRPKTLWSEQDPHAWWQAADQAISALARQQPLRAVRAIGLTGQMHGATLLDKRRQVLRPAILWNDGRSARECDELEQAVPTSRRITGNLMMPGFTAPKLKWLAQHEPAIFAQIDKVLLPKDYLRWKMCGTLASDMSDAAGTMWLDVGRRDWSDALLAACGLSRDAMPALFEGPQVTGELLPEIARRWGMTSVPVVAGGGDNAAGALGVGIYRQGQAMLSLGTSGVYFAASDGFLSNPESAVHSFCHALPDRWHLMSVMLSAAACLDWTARLTGLDSVPALLNEARNGPRAAPPLWFLPYLSGERTPHNNPGARGAFWGLSLEHQRADLCRAVLEGVSFALADCMDALHASGLHPQNITLIGGGARSAYWRQMLADVSGQTLEYRTGGDVGPALGAARLARMAMHPDAALAELLPAPPLEEVHEPDPRRHADYQVHRQTFRDLYRLLMPLTR